VSITLAIRDTVARHQQRINAIVIRGLSQLVAVVPALVVLAMHGAGGFGLFSILVAAAGLSVVFEWGRPLQVQNEVSRGTFSTPYDGRWLIAEGGLPLHLALNLVVALVLWRTAPAWLGFVFPGDVAGVLERHGPALLGVFVVAACSGATYQGRSIVFGLGHVDKGYAFALAGAVLSLVFVLAGLQTQAPPEMLAIAAAAAPLFERLLACAYCFGRRRPLPRHASLPPPLPAAGGSTPTRQRVAAMFFYLQLLALLASNMDTVYAARANSLAAVGEYAFLVKLFGVPLLVVSILSTAAMPRLAVEAHRHGAGATMRELLRSNLAVVALLGALVAAAAAPAYRLVSGQSADMMVLSLLLWLDLAVLALRSVLTTFVNAAEVIWLNVVGNTVYAAAAIALKIALVDRLGIEGLVIANVAAYVLFLLPFHLAALTRLREG
jgi:O-antigen/teichoic acid export membrane protein